MPAKLIDGKAIAAVIRAEIKAEVEDMQSRHGRAPGLATVLVGERKDSDLCAHEEEGLRGGGHQLVRA